MAGIEARPPVREGFRVQLIGEDPEILKAVTSVLQGVGEPIFEVTVQAPQAALEGNSSPDIAMVIFDGNEAGPLGYMQTRCERTPRPAIFALLQDRSPALMRRVLHAGADEVLFLPLDEVELTRVLMKLSERRRRNHRRQGGLICVVASLTGGTGVSTLSANLALALGYHCGKRAAVVDLDLQNGGLNVALHLTPEQTIASLIAFSGKLDSIKLEAALTKHPSGIYLLAAPRKLDDAERVTDLMVGSVLDLVRQLFDFVIVDCGSHVDEIAVAAWEHCDELLYVVDHSRVSCHGARRFIELFNRLGLRNGNPRFVLNKFDPQSGLTEAMISDAIGARFVARIPRDDRMLERMQLRVEDLWQIGPNSPLARAIEALAQRINERRDPAAVVSEGFVARLFGALGARA